MDTSPIASAYLRMRRHVCSKISRAVIDPAKRELTARRDISTGEAITVDYAHTEDRLVKQFACTCASPNCRRWIKGRKEEITSEGRDYLACIKAR